MLQVTACTIYGHGLVADQARRLAALEERQKLNLKTLSAAQVADQARRLVALEECQTLDALKP